MIVFRFRKRGDYRLPKCKAFTALGGVWVAIAIAAAFLIYLGYNAVTQGKARLKEQTENYAHLIAEHDRFGFSVADIILRDVLDELTDDDFNGAMSPTRKQQVHDYLVAHQARLPGIASFSIVGADGIRRVGAVGRDGTNLSDRAYFKELRAGTEFYISKVQNGRASGKPGIHVARRFTRPNGEFGGVIELNLGAEALFFDFYRSSKLGDGAATSLRDAQRVLIRFPDDIHKQIIGETVNDAIGAQISSGSDRGNLVTVDPTDGLKKFTAYERLEGSQMYATVSLPIDRWMNGPWNLALAAISCAAALLVGGVGIILAVRNGRELERARDEAMKAGEERQRLIRRLNTVVEDERRAVALDVHDVLNAVFLSIKLNSQAIARIAKEQATPVMKEITERATTITTCANDLYSRGRTMIERLRPEELDVLGLDNAVEEMVGSCNGSHPTCHFTFESIGDTTGIDPGVSIAAYRIVQEALSNVIKHAGATHAHVSLKVQQGELTVRIVDDGRGFSDDRKGPGLGLVGMRERAEAWGGTVEVRSGPKGEGGMIVARLPVKPSP